MATIKERVTTRVAFDGFSRAIFVGILSLFIAMRLAHLDFTLWNDEVFSVTTARLPWRMFFERIVNDIVHPPLFYVVLKSWMILGGESLMWLRLLPVSIAVITVLPFVALCRELKFSASDINLSLVLFGTNWFLTWHAQDIRMYPLLVFLTATSLWLFLRVISGDSKDRAALVGLCLVNVCLVYTHYYGWLVLLVEGCYAIFSKAQQFRRLIVVLIVTSLAFMPWALAVVTAIQAVGDLQRNLGFISRPDLKNILWFYVKLNGIFMSEWRTIRWAAAVGLLLFAYPIVLWGRAVAAGRGRQHGSEERTFWFLVIAAFVPVCVAFVASHILNVSFWADRYLMVSAVPYLLLVARSAKKLAPRWLRDVTVTLIAIWVGLAGLQGLTRERVSWGPVVQAMRNAESPRASKRRVVAIATYAYIPVEFYLAEAKDNRFDLVEHNSEGLERIVASGSSSDDNLWVAYHDSGDRRRRMPEEILLGGGYSLDERFESGSPGNKAVVLRVRRDLAGDRRAKAGP